MFAICNTTYQLPPFVTDYLRAGMDVNPSKVKTVNEKGATVVNLAPIAKLLARELTFDALAALPRLTKDSFRGKAYERAVSKATESQPRPEPEESSGSTEAAR